MPRHEHPNTLQVELPHWVIAEAGSPRGNPCLVSVAEEAYTALGLARLYGAEGQPACKDLLAAGMKSLRTLGDKQAELGLRCKAGDRAARKFWEAKVCARRARGG